MFPHTHLTMGMDLFGDWGSVTCALENSSQRQEKALVRTSTL